MSPCDLCVDKARQNMYSKNPACTKHMLSNLRSVSDGGLRTVEAQAGRQDEAPQGKRGYTRALHPARQITGVLRFPKGMAPSLHDPPTQPASVRCLL